MKITQRNLRAQRAKVTQRCCNCCCCCLCCCCNNCCWSSDNAADVGVSTRSSQLYLRLFRMHFTFCVPSLNHTHTHAHAHPCVLLFACLLLLLLLLALVDFAACVCRAYAGPAPKLMSGLGCGCAALFVFHLRSAPSRMQRFFPLQLPRCLCVCCTQNAARLRQAPLAATLPRSRRSGHSSQGVYVCFTYNRSTW